MSKGHALNAPSSADRTIQCPGSLGLIKSAPPEVAKDYASEGTAAHQLGAAAAAARVACRDFLGQESTDAPGWIYTEEMCVEVQKYVDHLHELVAHGGELLIEQRVSMEEMLPQCWGTSDAIILHDDEIHVVDLKYGRGVKVDAENNAQLMLYALGAYLEHRFVADIQTVRMTIVQPRLDHVSEWSCSVEELLDWVTEVAQPAFEKALECYANPALALAHLSPSEDACRFCRAKATCPALQAEVERTTGAMFDDLEQVILPEPGRAAALEQQMAKVGLIEDWCKAVRAETERRLLAGQPVRGWKLVEGRSGARKWADPSAAETLLRKSWRLKVEDAYDMSLITPTSAEKLVKKGLVTERQWAKAQDLISRSEGKPSVAPESDKRPALVISNPADAFEDLSSADSLV